ncbi:MAG: kynureninase [Bacteroidota bacterium]|nr:kynureninase [Candidatus Kapabacteria bacterium]MDW8220485.1 kynureninase [Bacteroidota bacterium]
MLPVYYNSLDFARQCDEADVLQHFRHRFLFPQRNNREVLYFTGNSLGLQPKSVRTALEQELSDWATLGVEGHFRATVPWWQYHKAVQEPLARIVGAQPHEVVAMNTLTVNLHLLLATFYQPTPQRFHILCEAGAFPSDDYALETHVALRGLDPRRAIVEVVAKDQHGLLCTEDIVQAIDTLGDSLALVMFSGVQYYTGQAFDIRTITRAAHCVGAIACFDLAHAVGNIVLKLHEWDVDAAAWCSYKYLNSSPGGIAGVFIHERHAMNKDLPRLAGWWGNDESERFQMKKGFRPASGAQAWQLSNPPALLMATHKAALEIFDEAGIERLRAKSEALTGFLEFIIRDVAGTHVRIITPSNPAERGAQLSLIIERNGRAVFQHLLNNGVIVDWREPDVVRVAPVPLYNSFEDVWRFGECLKKALDAECQ